jgi:hypothetical protein
MGNRLVQTYVFEGDYGGQLYLTVPVACVGEGAKLEELLSVLDALAWPCNEGEGATLHIKELDPETGDDELTWEPVYEDGVWLDPEFATLGDLHAIRHLLALAPETSIRVGDKLF